MTAQHSKPIPVFSRREFLKASGFVLAGAAVACTGRGFRARDQELPGITYQKEDRMDNKILIAYATRAGSTAEIAAEVGSSLSARGFAVDVWPLEDKPSLAGYQAVILGSAIRMGSWLPEAVGFIEDNQAQLQGLPTALFTVHMLNAGDDPESRANRLAYLDRVRPLLPDAEEVYFRGVMDFSKLSFLDRMIANLVGAEEADDRDWEKIRDWMPGVISQELSYV